MWVAGFPVPMPQPVTPTPALGRPITAIGPAPPPPSYSPVVAVCVTWGLLAVVVTSGMAVTLCLSRRIRTPGPVAARACAGGRSNPVDLPPAVAADPAVRASGHLLKCRRGWGQVPDAASQ